MLMVRYMKLSAKEIQKKPVHEILTTIITRKQKALLSKIKANNTQKN